MLPQVVGDLLDPVDGQRCRRFGFDADGRPLERYFLHFEGAANRARVFVNGELAVDHAGPYTPFRPEITGLVKPGENLIAVHLDTREDPAIPPFGGVVDYLVYGGIYREVFLERRPAVHIADVFVRPEFTPSADSVAILVDVQLDGGGAGQTISLELLDAAGSTVAGPVSYPAGGLHASMRLEAPRIQRWDIDNPVLYTLCVRLLPAGLAGAHGPAAVDEYRVRTGFREARFTSDGFFLNGRRVVLRGLNRHQSWPHLGYAMPASIQREEADLLVDSLACNYVRTSHYPQSRHFLERCDERGLLVFTETPGWQHIGTGEWHERVLDDIRAMITRDRNHPSVILWGVRINESQDCRELYTRTNALARELDPSRQTGGVRYIKKSELLEDVYTFNDFTHAGERVVIAKPSSVARRKVPYLITEYNGHMFPTKSVDDEAQRLEHALRHARVLNAVYATPGVAGCSGWCMADYNTHRDFGSGDRICHHGVLDMFRVPKLAAAVYASQGKAAPGSCFLEVSSSMDIGEHPGGRLGSVWAFTNADFVRVYKNGRQVCDAYPCRRQFPALPHPPILVDDFIGDALEREEGLSPAQARIIKPVLVAATRYGQALPLIWKLRALWALLCLRVSWNTAVQWYGRQVMNWGSTRVSYRFEAWRDGKPCAAVERSTVSGVRLVLDAPRRTLDPAVSRDALRVEVRAVDQHGNRLPYCFAGLHARVEGPAHIAGNPAGRDQYCSLIAGARALWIVTLPGGGPGEQALAKPSPGPGGSRETISLTVDAEGIGSASIELFVSSGRE